MDEKEQKERDETAYKAVKAGMLGDSPEQSAVDRPIPVDHPDVKAWDATEALEEQDKSEAKQAKSDAKKGDGSKQ